MKAQQCTSYHIGDLFGEDMIISKPTAKMSAQASKDTILLELNIAAFDLVVRDRLRKEQEALSSFIYQAIPGMKDQFTKNQLQSVVHTLFSEHVFYKDQFILQEDKDTDIVVEPSSSSL